MKGAEPFRNALCRTRCVALLDDRLPGAPHNPILDGLPSTAKPSHIIVVVVAQKLVIALIVGRDVCEVDFVSQYTTDTTEALDELRAFLGLVCDKLRARKSEIRISGDKTSGYFEVGTKLGIFLREPLQQALWLTNLIHFRASRLVNELFAVLLLLFVGIDNEFLCWSISV